MKFLGAAALLLAATQASAQIIAPSTDPRLGGVAVNSVRFPQYGYQTYFIFPQDKTTYPNEFVVSVTGSHTNQQGWTAVTVGGGMTYSLIFLAWPWQGKVIPSLRITGGFVEPEVYTGNAKLTVLDQFVNSTHYQITARCQNCFSGSQNGVSWDLQTQLDAGFSTFGYAQASLAPTQNPASANSAGVIQHDKGFGNFGVISTNANFYSSNANYAKAIGYGTTTTTTTTRTTTTTTRTTTTTTTTRTTTTTTTATTTTTVVGATPTGTYDYIIVGGGAGGQVLADRLSESGQYQVLLLERGQPSTWAHGGRDAPAWAAATQTTRYDVPGLCNEIWANSTGISCPDYDNMAGCVLGGGTAINAGLFWKPNRRDFDYNFPAGWQGNDIQSAITKVFNKIPGTQASSQDGKYYLDELYNTVAPTLTSNGFTAVNPITQPDAKNFTINRPSFMFIKGERGGPLATYMLTARSRSNFKIWFHTMGARVTRSGSRITGVDVEAQANGGYTGNVQLKTGGKVILTAGAFGTPKILWRSGIGSLDQLQVVAGVESSKMPPQSQWIYLPVGYNLMDHTNTDMVFEHPNIKPYDFYAAFDEPIAADRQAYVSSRSGVLATAAPGISLGIHHYVKGIDGIDRGIQWTGRDEGSLGYYSNTSITLSQYLGTGITSRGRLTITPQLRTAVTTKPWATTAADTQAIIDGLTILYNALSKVQGLTWIYPEPNSTPAQLATYVKQYVAGRGTNHWMGSCKMGTDDGRQSNGVSGSVVDTNTKVYGTDNLFIVDASIFPGMVQTNPTAPILVVAEHAAQKILNYGSTSTCGTATTTTVPGTVVTRTVTPAPVTITVTPGQTTTTTRTTTTTTRTTTTTTTTRVIGDCAAKYGQCGGQGWTGATCCQSGSTCRVSNQYYSQCL